MPSPVVPTTVNDLQGRIKMHDGHTIPQLGLGVYEMTNEEAYQAVMWALEAGYRHVDTAEWYENEEACGKAIVDFLKQNPSIPRSSIFYTTKLRDNVSRSNTLSKVRESLSLVSGLEYIDLYLLHSPLGGKKIRKGCWEGCLDAKAEGLVRSLGVSNYGDKHIQEIIDWGLELPVLNQIDLHPFMRREKIVKICEENGVILEAWAPLVRALRFKHPVVVKIAEKHGVSPAQVLLRWSLQHGYVPIPKSVSKARIVANGDLFGFKLADEDMKELDGLDEYLVTDWDVVDTA